MNIIRKRFANEVAKSQLRQAGRYKVLTYTFEIEFDQEASDYKETYEHLEKRGVFFGKKTTVDSGHQRVSLKLNVEFSESETTLDEEFSNFMKWITSRECVSNLNIENCTTEEGISAVEPVETPKSEPQPKTQITQTHQIEVKEPMLSKIQRCLKTRFIETDKVAKLLSLALEGEKNCILWGAAGHGKSEMVAAAIEGLDLSNGCFIQSFGEGMDEARLFGGLDFAKLEEEKILEYNPDRSFLNHKVAVFEELFDAPPIVLLALKDTLTAREFRNGPQRYKMKTKSIIALTNRSPSEISELGPASHALIERFPLQLEVKWDKYDKDMFINMFKKVHPEAPEFIREMLAGMCAEVHDGGGFISPRSAVHALETLMLASESNGSDGTQDIECFQALAFVPGFENLVGDIDSEMDRRFNEIRVQKELKEICGLHDLIEEELASTTDAMECLKNHREIDKLSQRLGMLKVPDSLVEHRNKVSDALIELTKNATQKAIDLTP